MTFVEKEVRRHLYREPGAEVKVAGAVCSREEAREAGERIEVYVRYFEKDDVYVFERHRPDDWSTKGKRVYPI